MWVAVVVVVSLPALPSRFVGFVNVLFHARPLVSASTSHDVPTTFPRPPNLQNYRNNEKQLKTCKFEKKKSKETNNNLENIAYVSLRYENDFIAHLHLNWLSPVKIRKTIICGREKMLVWNDLESAEKVKIYDKLRFLTATNTELSRISFNLLFLF